MPPIKVAVLDDYQRVAREMADWSALEHRADVTFFHDHLSDPQEVTERLAPFHILCVMRERTPLGRPLLERLPNLKLVVSTGARNASIDLAAAKESGVIVCHTRYIGQGAAELTWALVLVAVKYIPAEYSSVRDGGWQTRIGGDLKGATLGILGLGNLGGTVARFGRAFDMNVIAWSTNLTDAKAVEHGARLVSKQQLFRESDIVTVHLVFTERTRKIVGSEEIGLMKPTAWLVNTSRGPVVDEQALIAALKNEAIAGAALDVFDTEPLPADHPFRTLPNVIATPHIGFVTQGTYRLFYQDTVECVLAWLDGNPIRRMN
jgi:phosphoglycerate dehydrogenase-like enzyme